MKNNVVEKQPTAWLRRFEVYTCWAGLRKGRCRWSELAVLRVLLLVLFSSFSRIITSSRWLSLTEW